MAKSAKHDACYRQVMARYHKWSARAAQATAKCRKHHGEVRKTKAGANLKRWEREDWRNTKTGRTCGNKKDKHEYCRPTKKVSSRTPKLLPHNTSANQKRKGHGQRAKRAT